MRHSALLILKGVEDQDDGIMLLVRAWFEFSQLSEIGDT